MKSTDTVPRIFTLGKYLGLFAIVAICVHGTVFRGLTWDFINFYDAGHKILAGQISDLYDPLALIEGKKAQGTQPFRGAPISAYLYAPLALLSPDAALVAFKVQSVLVLWLALFLLYRHFRQFVDDSPKAQQRYATIFVLVAAAFQPLWTVLYVGGQITPLILLLFTMALIFHSSARFVLSALCLVVAVTIKPGYATALAFIALVSGRRFLLSVLAIGGVMGAASLLIVGWDMHVEYLHIVLSETSKVYRPHWNSTVFGWIDWFFMPPTSRSGLMRPAESAVLILILRVSVVVFFAWLWFDTRKLALTAAARHHLYAQMGLVFALLVMPVLWEHYLMMVFVLVAYVIASSRYFSTQALCTIGLIVLFASGQHLAFVTWMATSVVYVNSTPEMILLAVYKAMPLLLTLTFLVRHKNELYASYGAPAWRAVGTGNGNT